MVLLIFTALPLNANPADPTRPPNAMKSISNAIMTSSNPLTLMAVFIYSKNKFAVINDRLVRVGDHFGEYIVTSIDPYTVRLTGPLNTVDTLLLAAPIKRRVKI